MYYPRQQGACIYTEEKQYCTPTTIFNGHFASKFTVR